MNQQTSFAKQVKEEIVSKKFSNERLLAILSSFTKSTGSVLIRNKKEFIVLKIENNKIAKFIYETIQKLFNITPSISYLKKKNLSKNTCYHITLSNSSFLDKLHINFLENKIDKFFTKNKEIMGGYLTGAFLASGSVNSPRSSNYHLEMSFLNENYAKWFQKLMLKYKDTNLASKIIKRRDKYVVYIKRSDRIADFLILIGATDSCLYFENTRVDRDFSNVTNRLQNLDTANYQKTIKASKNDIKIIKKLIKVKGLMNLGSEKVVNLAELRIKHPEATLDELAELLSKALRVEVSKSNVNHILRSLRVEGRNL